MALDNITNELSELRIRSMKRKKTSKKNKMLSEKYAKQQRTVSVGIEKGETGTAACVERQIYGRKIEVHIFADLFDITDEKWKNAIEGRLGRIKKSMITEPAYALDAAKIFRRMQQFEEVDLINSEAVPKGFSGSGRKLAI